MDQHTEDQHTVDQHPVEQDGAQRRTVHPLRGAVVSRRGALAAGGTLGSVLTLAACGTDEPAAETTATSSDSAPAAAGGVLTTLADVPVGSAVVLDASDGVPVVVAQPTSGEVVGFSARCTHNGCAVAVADAELDCPCHGSRFDALTGEVLAGPATEPLAPFAVRIDGENVVADA